MSSDTVTLGEICNAIRDTLGEATEVTTKYGYAELRESPQPADLPMLTIFPENGTCDISGGTDATTFSGFVRQKQFLIYADVIAAQRSNLDEDMENTVDVIDSIINVLEEQNDSFFGLDGIKSFHWRFEKAVYRYGNSVYLGARFGITVRVF